MKKLIAIFTLFFLVIAGCQEKKAANAITVGTIVGPETQLMEVAKNVAKKKYNLDVNIAEFSDYNIPNAALNEGSIDANMFQTIPFFDADVKARHFKLSVVGRTFIYPMAIYSNKVKSLAQVPNNAIVAIPNDLSNETRALLLLQTAGLIQLDKTKKDIIVPSDIIENSKHLQIKTLDAAQLPRVLPDVTLAVINTNYAVPAGLYPSKNGLFVENKDSPYANILVVRTQDKDDPRFKQLVAALHDPEVVAAANKLFENEAVPAW